MIDSSFRPTARSTRVVTVRWYVITELSSSPVSLSVSTHVRHAAPAFPEEKWRRDRVSREQADAFASKVQRKSKNALGLLLSVNGFSQDGIDKYNKGISFMTADGADLYCVLDQRAWLDDLLRRKKRHAKRDWRVLLPSEPFV